MGERKAIGEMGTFIKKNINKIWNRNRIPEERENENVWIDGGDEKENREEEDKLKNNKWRKVSKNHHQRIPKEISLNNS